MEKIIKLLKEEVSKLRGYAVIIDGEDGEWEPVTTVSMEDIYEIINQLDGLEFLSQEWIDEHITDGHNVNLGDKVVYADELDGVLVPKQEITEEQFTEYLRERSMTAVDSTLVYRENLDNKIIIEKPTIPEFVADFLDGKEKYTLYELFDDEFIYDNHDELARWLYDNDEKTNKKRELSLVLAQRYGYTVEEEQKYFVEDGKHTLLCKWESSDGWKVISTIEATEDDLPIEVLDFGLTEQEIKDYDPRYWAFRKPVEEVEG